jgi:hypothetical protein
VAHQAFLRFGVQVFPRLDGTGSDHLAAPVRIRRTRLVAVAPLWIGLASAARERPSQREVIEGGMNPCSLLDPIERSAWRYCTWRPTLPGELI